MHSHALRLSAMAREKKNMLAKYKGRCGKCGRSIAVGEEISWSRQERGKIYHIACKVERASAGAVSAPVAKAPVAKASAPASGLSANDAELLATLKALLAAKTASAPVETPSEEEPSEEDYAGASEDVASKLLSKQRQAVTSASVKAKGKALASNAPWYDVLAAILPATSRVLLFGPPSTGKSTTAMLLAGIRHRITMTETTSREDLIGMFHLIDGETKWVDGPFTVAMREGEAVLLDEVDRYSPECASLLYSLIDDRPHITLPTGELVEAKEGYRVVMTTNESVETLPTAVQDRIEVLISAGTPHPDALDGVDDAAKDVVMRYYTAQPKRKFRMYPTVRRMRAFYHLLGAGIPNAIAANLVFGEDGAKEVLSVITSAEGN